jgi:hypothetical protein
MNIQAALKKCVLRCKTRLAAGLTMFPSLGMCAGALFIISVSTPLGAQVQWPENSEAFHINSPGEVSSYLTFGMGSLWMIDTDHAKIWRIDPLTGAVQASIDSGWGGGIAFDGRNLWIARSTGPAIRCIRPNDGTTVREIPGVGTEQAGLAWDGSYLWIADRSTQRIYRIHPDTGAQVSSFDSPGPQPRGLAWWNGYLYHTDRHEGRIYQIDPSTGRVISSVATPMRSGSPRGLAIDDAAHLWYSDWNEGIDRMVIDVSTDDRVIRSNPILMLAEMTYAMTNTGTVSIENPVVYWSIPMADSEHILVDVAFDPAPDSHVADAFGQTIAHFTISEPVPPGNTAQVACHAYAKIWRIDYQIDSTQVSPLSSIPQEIRDLYLIDGEFLHITHPEIVAAAVSAVETETNPYLMAIKLHDFVAETMTYGDDGITLDALEILRSPLGGCDHYTVLYMALGRAVGLPTRKVKSFYYYENEDYALSHVWPEAYIPDYGWIPFDPTRDDTSPLRHRYIGCEPLGIVYFRNGGTDATYVGQSARSWRTGGVSRISSTAFCGTAPLAATQCDSVPGESFGSVYVSWQNPPAIDLRRIIVRRCEERYPASREDGVPVNDNSSPTPGATASVTDSGLDPSKEYYYTVFAQSATGLWSRSTLDGENANHSVPAATGTPAVFRVEAVTGNVLADGSFYGQNFLAGAADVAEWVLVSEEVEPGDVLELDPENPGHYRKSRGPSSNLVAGVVSTDPGFILGSSSPTLDSGPWTDDSRFPTDDSRLATEDSALLALIGIVPVKVTDEGGPIKPGDLLVASSTPGYAMRWDHQSGEACGLIGKALEPLEDSKGVIKVILMG